MKSPKPAILILDQDGIGARVAEVRKLRGLTQQGLAMAVPCSKSLVSQVERGVKPVTPWFVAAMARALRTSVTELTGQPYRGSTERTDRVHAAIPALRIALTYWDVAPESPAAPRPLAPLRADTAVIAGLLDRMDYLALGSRLPALIEELAAAWHGSAGRPRQETAELLMYAAIAVKAMAYRLGYTDLVSVAIERATAAAHATGHPEPVALATEERSQAFFAAGAYGAGLKFLAQAHRDFDELVAGTEPGLAITGSMYLRAAIMAAREPGQRQQAWDYLAQAQEVAARIGRDTNHHGLVFGPTNVRIHEVATAIELEDPDEAIRRNEGFRPPPELPPERSSHHYIDLSRARLVAGQRPGALRDLATAERLAPQHTRNHPMARETVTGLVRVSKRPSEALRTMARRMGVTVGAA